MSGGPEGRDPVRHRKILIIDDEPDITEEMVELLSDHGLHATVVNNAEEGRQTALLDSEISVVITDVRMPGLDGYGLIRQMKHELVRKGRSPQFIVVTGHAGMEEEMEARRLGVFAFIPKPVQPRDLLRVTRAALEQNKSR
jgi:DNA-binding NtrC family response regulator